MSEKEPPKFDVSEETLRNQIEELDENFGVNIYDEPELTTDQRDWTLAEIITEDDHNVMLYFRIDNSREETFLLFHSDMGVIEKGRGLKDLSLSTYISRQN